MVFVYFLNISFSGSEIITMFSILVGFLALGIGMNQKNKSNKKTYM